MIVATDFLVIAFKISDLSTINYVTFLTVSLLDIAMQIK